MIRHLFTHKFFHNQKNVQSTVHYIRIYCYSKGTNKQYMYNFLLKIIYIKTVRYWLYFLTKENWQRNICNQYWRQYLRLKICLATVMTDGHGNDFIGSELYKVTVMICFHINTCLFVIVNLFWRPDTTYSDPYCEARGCEFG